MKCDICQSTITEADSVCKNCGVSLPVDLEVKRSFRDLLVDIEYWFVNLSKLRIVLFLISIYFLVGFAVTFISESSIFTQSFYIILAIIYCFLGILFRPRSKTFLYSILAFYISHTSLEFTLNYIPTANNFTVSDGWVGFIPIVLSLLPIVFILIRIILIYYFVLGIQSTIKLSNNEITTNYWLKNKG